MIVLLVMTDGREGCIERSIPAALQALQPAHELTRRVIHDDSANPVYRSMLRERFPDFQVIGGDERRGFGGAIQHAWRYLLDVAPEPYVFHLEDDFLLTRPVNLVDMRRALRHHLHLEQLALLRGPVNRAEHAAGGVIEQHPGDYTTVECGLCGEWREHRRFWTTNPSLYRAQLTARGWPDGGDSEGRFGIELFRQRPDARAAFWGADGVWCEHIGHERVGTGY